MPPPATVTANAAPVHNEDVRQVRWTRKQYHQMAGQGFFNGRRVELIEGRIYRMAPQTEPHAASVNKAYDALKLAFGTGYYVRCQNGLDLGERSEPEPDLAVVPGKAGDYKETPRSALLVVEVSLTTLKYDRVRKAGLYAKAGILDYWIVNLIDSRLEVYRTPYADPSMRYGFGYAPPIVLAASDIATPLAKPDARIAVRDLLP
jgi:Uma2 family endonuclease